MALKAQLDSLDGLDDTVSAHYVLDTKTNKYVLGVEDVDTLPRVRTLKDEAAQNRIKARDLDLALAPFRALGDLPDVAKRVAKLPELEAAVAAGTGTDEAKIASLVEARVKGAVGPVQRELDNAKNAVAQYEREIAQLRSDRSTRTLHDAVREAASKAGLRSSAVDDALSAAERVFEVNEAGEALTKDGLSPASWLQDMQPKRPHWWPDSEGAGSRSRSPNGTRVGNPWTHEAWNMTEQGNLFRANPEQATKLAKAAGTSIGGARPPKRN